MRHDLELSSTLPKDLATSVEDHLQKKGSIRIPLICWRSLLSTLE